jgi:hypothetical protein
MTTKMMLTLVAAVAGLQGAAVDVSAQTGKFQETITVKSPAHPVLADHALTFSAPVALPGLSLQPGTYLFRQASPSALQVANMDGTPYAMFLTIPTVRASLTDGYAVVVGEPGAPGSPRRLIAVFEPGEYTGRQFIYPKR